MHLVPLHAPLPDTLPSFLFLGLGLFTSAAILSAIPGLLLLALSLVLRRGRVLAVVSALAWTLAQTALFVDTRVYGIFRYHMNGMVWNVLTTPGSEEAVHLSWIDLTIVGAGAALVFAGELALQRLLRRLDLRRRERGERPALFVRPTAVWGLLLVPALLVQSGIYARSDLVRDRRVMALSRLYPACPRVTMKRFLAKHFGVVLEDRPKVDLPEGGILLHYPIREPSSRPDGPRPNLVLIVIDSLRADVLRPGPMPRPARCCRARACSATT